MGNKKLARPPERLRQVLTSDCACIKGTGTVVEHKFTEVSYRD